MHPIIFFGYVFGTIKLTLLHSVIGLPDEAWWLPLLVFVILAAASIVDAFSSIVPDSLIFLGLLAVISTQAIYLSWPYASWHLLMAGMAGGFIWLVNTLYRLTFKVEALGMGDAKWTALAAACFNLPPIVIAWGIGAWLALAWIGVLKLAHYQVTRVYFTPFLFLGLMGGIYWSRSHMY